MGFDFTPESALSICKQWLDAGEDLDLEHIETQRATLQNMLKHHHRFDETQRQSVEAAEKILYNYLCSHGGISSPVLHDDALGGDLIHAPLDRGEL
jgi:hypothetical protein